VLARMFERSLDSATCSRFPLPQLFVDGSQLPIRRLHLFFRRLQLLVGALQLLVTRLDLFVGRAQLLLGGLVLLGRGAMRAAESRVACSPRPESFGLPSAPIG
jgi:hypothetical protein